MSRVNHYESQLSDLSAAFEQVHRYRRITVELGHYHRLRKSRYETIRGSVVISLEFDLKGKNFNGVRSCSRTNDYEGIKARSIEFYQEAIQEGSSNRNDK